MAEATAAGGNIRAGRKSKAGGNIRAGRKSKEEERINKPKINISMRINTLFKALLAAPMLLMAISFVACDRGGDDVVTPPTVEVTEGEATDTTLSFTITAAEADKVAYTIYLATESAPKAEDILATGEDVTNSLPATRTEGGLQPETEYVIIAAASNEGGVVASTPLTMTTKKTPDPVENPELSVVAGNGMEFEAEGGNGTIEYEIKNAVEGVVLTAEAEAAWVADVKVVAAESKVTYTVAANDKAESRSTKITLTYGELTQVVTISQKPYVKPGEPALSLKSEAVKEFTADGGNGEFAYEVVNPVEGTELKATVAEDAAWISDVKVDTAANKVTYKVAANDTFEAREAKVTLTYGELKVEVTVKQAGRAKPELALKSEAEKSFTAEGGAGEFEFELKNPVEGTELKATTDAAWITDVKVEGSKVAYKVAANEEEKAREAKVTLTYGELSVAVTVKQTAANAPALALKSEATKEFTAEGGNGEFAYELKNAKADVELEAKADVQWITDVKVDAAASKVTYKVAANEEKKAREGKVTLTYDDLKVEVTVKQEAKEPEAEPVLTISSDPVKRFAAEGGSGSISYTIENATEETELIAVVSPAETEWITISEVTATTVNYTVAANEEYKVRQAYVVLMYGEQSATVRITQDPKEREYEIKNVEFSSATLGHTTPGGILVKFADATNAHELNLIFYADEKAALPAGVYKPGYQFDGSLGYNADSYMLVGGVEHKYNAEKNTVDATVEVTADGEAYTFKFNDILFGDEYIATGTCSVELSFEKEENPFNATHTATKWLWSGPSSYGNKYAVSGDGFTIDVHFPTSVATESSLTTGEYVWKGTSFFSNSDATNFTTRSFKLGGSDDTVPINDGSAKVTVSGDTYTIQLTLVHRDSGYKYMIEYVGKLNDAGEQGGGDINPDGSIKLTSFAYLYDGTENYNGHIWKATGKDVDMRVKISANSCTSTSIKTGDYEANGDLTGDGYFQLTGSKYNGIDLGTGTSMKVENSGGQYKITIVAGEYTFVFNGELSFSDEF